MRGFDEQDLEELTTLVNKAQAEEMVDCILIRNSPSNRMINLKQLEMKLIRMKGKVTT